MLSVFYATKRRMARYATVAMLMGLMLTLLVVAPPAMAQSAPTPAAPTNLKAKLTATQGQVHWNWNAVAGATKYRACDRAVRQGAKWDCDDTTTLGMYSSNLTVGVTYEFAVASVKDGVYSRWAKTRLLIEDAIPHLCPITGMPIPAGGYKSVGDTVRANGVSVTVTGASFPADTDRQLTNDRRFIKICATVSKGESSYYNGNLDTDAGLSMQWNSLDNCARYDIPANATVAIFAVRPWRDNASSVDGHPFLYRFNVPAN